MCGNARLCVRRRRDAPCARSGEEVTTPARVNDLLIEAAPHDRRFEDHRARGVTTTDTRGQNGAASRGFHAGPAGRSLRRVRPARVSPADAPVLPQLVDRVLRVQSVQIITQIRPRILHAGRQVRYTTGCLVVLAAVRYRSSCRVRPASAQQTQVRPRQRRPEMPAMMVLFIDFPLCWLTA